MFDDLAALENYVASQTDIAFISEDVPLLRDLNAVENIALILEYHKGMSIKNAEKFVFELLDKLGIGYIKDKKIYEIDKKDTIILKYLRAYVSDFNTILISKPFSMLDQIEDLDTLFDLFGLLDSKDVKIVDLKSNTYYEDKNVI